MLCTKIDRRSYGMQKRFHGYQMQNESVYTLKINVEAIEFTKFAFFVFA